VVVLASQHLGDQGNLVDAYAQAVEDLLAESLPIDLKALDQAIEHYLGRMDALGDTLTDLLVSDGMRVGLGGAAVFGRWRRRR